MPLFSFLLKLKNINENYNNIGKVGKYCSFLYLRGVNKIKMRVNSLFSRINKENFKEICLLWILCTLFVVGLLFCITGFIMMIRLWG